MLALTQRCDRCPIKKILTAVGAVEQAHDIEQCRLAATTRAHDDDEFAFFDAQVDVVQGVLGSVAQTILLSEASEFYNWCRRSYHNYPLV